jgi:hypothetical protein
MFGIVQAKTALVRSKTVGKRKVSLQCWSIMKPMKMLPKVLPIRPTIIEKQIAIALKS